MVIFDRKTLSYRDENGKFVIFSLNLLKTNIKKTKKSVCKCFTVNSTLHGTPFKKNTYIRQKSHLILDEADDEYVCVEPDRDEFEHV